MYDDDNGNPIECPACSNTDIRRSGIQGKKQRYQCKACLKYFIPKPRAAEQKKLLKHKLAIMLYSTGARMKEIEEFTGKRYPTLKSWLGPVFDFFEQDRALKEIRRKPDTDLTIMDTPPKQTDLKGKCWLIVEVEKEAFDGKSVVISNKNSP
ncbi:MAG: hypothetical protein MRY32_00110 [Rickettsiales bacterium]|nr:hypothetical protein [Rickettsiales bacterium]